MRALWTSTGLLVAALAAFGIVSVALIVESWRFFRLVEAGDLLTAPASAMFASIMARMAAYGFARLALLLACPALWLVWQWIASTNVHERLPEGVMRFRAGRGLLWWFVPGASFWMPFDVVQEIYLGSVVATEPETPHEGPDPGAHLLRAWWAASCIGLGLQVAVWTVAPRWDREFAEALVGLASFAEVFTALAAGFAIAVVVRVALFQRAWPPQGAPARSGA